MMSVGVEISGRDLEKEGFTLAPGTHFLHIKPELSNHQIVRLSLLLYSCPEIIELNLFNCRLRLESTVILARVLPSCPALSELNLGWNDLGPKGAAVLAEVLPSCPELSVLNLASNKVGPGGIRALAEGFRKCPKLSQLNLSSNDAGPEGLLALVEALPKCPKLSHLDLYDNSLGPEGTSALAKALLNCPELSQLNLSDNAVGQEGTSALAKVLPSYPKLSQFHLCLNKLGPKGISALAWALPSCPKLSLLDLSDELLGPEGVAVLAQVLPNCPKMRVLRMWGTQLGLEGVSALVKVLPNCSELSELDLGGNHLGLEGISVLAKVFPNCPKLSVLGLQSNNLGPEGAAALAEVLPKCLDLSVLKLWNNDIGSKGEEALDEVSMIGVFLTIEGTDRFECYAQRGEAIRQYMAQLRVWSGATKECLVHPQVCLQYLYTDEVERDAFCKGFAKNIGLWLFKNLGELPVVTGVGREYLKAITAYGERELEKLSIVLNPVLRRGLIDEHIVQLCDTVALLCYKMKDYIGAMAYYSACNYSQFPTQGTIFGILFQSLSKGKFQESIGKVLGEGNESAIDFILALNKLIKGNEPFKEEVQRILHEISKAQIKIGVPAQLVLAAFSDLEEIDQKQVGYPPAEASVGGVFSEAGDQGGKACQDFQAHKV